MINTHDYANELRQEAGRSKERVRQLLAIQIEAQIEAQMDEDHATSKATDSETDWSDTDVSQTGEFKAICI